MPWPSQASEDPGVIEEVVEWGRATSDWVVSYTELFDRHNLTAALDCLTVDAQKARKRVLECVSMHDYHC